MATAKKTTRPASSATKLSSRGKAVRNATRRVKTKAPIDFARSVRGR